MVNYLLLNDSVVLNFNAQTVTISAGDSRYAKVMELINQSDKQPEKLDEIPAAVDLGSAFKTDRTEIKDGLLHVDGQPMPIELHNRIMRLKEQGSPFEPLFKFWENLKQNPSFNSRQMLYAFLEHNGHPLTKDGCFIAYRGVTEDFKDKQTGKFDNSPGAVCEMDRNEVDDNPNNTCSRGLHVACFDYAKGFGSKLVEVKVNPKDVVCVPTDYNGTKMRTCRFEVIQECAQIRTEELYPSEETEAEDDERAVECVECGDEHYNAGEFCEDCEQNRCEDCGSPTDNARLCDSCN